MGAALRASAGMAAAGYESSSRAPGKRCARRGASGPTGHDARGCIHEVYIEPSLYRASWGLNAPFVRR